MLNEEVTETYWLWPMIVDESAIGDAESEIDGRRRRRRAAAGRRYLRPLKADNTNHILSIHQATLRHAPAIDIIYQSLSPPPPAVQPSTLSID